MMGFALRDRLGRSWQCGTFQLESVLPSRLNASYIGSDGGRATPLMIHHAVFGSIGRFIAMLLEHYAGALPFWLSPDQVAVTPISHDHSDYATKVLEALGAEDIRCVLFAGAETLSRRIVAAHESSIPVVAVVVAAVGAFGAARTRRAIARLEIDRSQKSNVADVDHMRRVLQRVRGVFPHRRQASRALEQAKVLIDIERSQRSGAGKRMG